MLKTHKILATPRWYGELCARHSGKTEPVERNMFDNVVLAVIIANLVVLLWGLLDSAHEELVEFADELILVFFVGEAFLRIKAAGRRFYRDGWLWFDLTVLVLALLPLGADILALRIVRAARLVHLGKHLPHLRHLSVLRWVGWLTQRVSQ